MSYDLWILPAEHCADASAAEAHVAGEWGRTGQAAAQAVADRITARDPGDDDSGFLSCSPLDAEGDVVIVPSPFSRIQAARDATLTEALPAGFAVYDPQNGVLLDPRTAVDGVMTSRTEGDYPVITPAAVEHLCGRLRVDDFLVVETGPEFYCQTMRQTYDAYDVEYRDGSAGRHFRTSVDTADRVAGLMTAWLRGGPAAVREDAATAWEKLDL
ncbi:hypothetical protein [Gordonia sp. (in: high G+C Gram-positive bacteria)]|uniref:hypothetical protein n=1 Tax=Gordonia sp. (in: high G+C Gram-positive bacteria) TaxID=84139 RepID=UPI003526F4CB